MSIALEAVAFAHGNGPDILSGVSVSASEGEVVAVMGPSGSGKSTLLSIAAGFLTPRVGRVMVGDQDMTHVPPERRNLGLVPQGYALFPAMTVAENVSYPLRLRKVPVAEQKRRVEHVLGLVGMESLLDRRPAALSGGQRQRVALARALVFEPSALLLDEPLSALDTGLRRQLRGEIRSLQRKTATACLLVTHDAEEAMTMADRIVLLSGGRVLQSGTPDDVYRLPVNEAAARLTGPINALDARVIDSCRIETALGELHCRPHLFPANTPVTALIRPAFIEQGRAESADADHNSITDVGIATVQAGGIVEISVTKGGTTLCAIATRVVPGNTVTIAANDIVVVPRVSAP